MCRIISKPIAERSLKENYISADFLERTRLSSKLKQDADESSVFRIIFMCASNMHFRQLKEHEVLFRLGEVGDNMYVILSGSVMILKTKEVKRIFNADSYLLHLADLYNNLEVAICKKVIALNIDIFYFDYEDIEHIDKILLRSRFRFVTQSDKSVTSMEQFFIQYCINPSEYGINFEELYSKEKRSESQLDIYTVVLQKLSTNINYEKYTFVENQNTSYEVTSLEYEDFLILNQGSAFGEASMGSVTAKRNATIKGYSSVTILGAISSSIYRENVLIEDERQKAKEETFLIENYFFRNITRNIFDRKYFNNFIKEEFKRGKILFNQNERVDNIYFVRQGELELSINRNYFEMFNIINQLSIIEGTGRDVKILFPKRV